MADQQLVIQIQAQIGNLQSALNSVQNQVRGLGSAAQGAVAPVSNLGNMLKTALGVVGIASIGQIVTKLKAFAQEAVKAFTEADSAARQFMNTLQQRGVSAGNALSASTAVASMAVPAGFEPEVIQQAIGNMIIKMNSGADATLGMSVAMDDARAKGITLATAVQQVSIAALGSLKALRQFGITTNKDVNGVLKDASTLLKEMAANVKGGLATFMASPLGMIATMKVSLQELKEMVGEGLTKAFAPVAAMVTGFSRGLMVMGATASSSAGVLTDLAVRAEEISMKFYTAAMMVKLFGIGLSTLDPFMSKATRAIQSAAFEKTFADMKTAQGAATADIIKMQNSTPEERMAEYWKNLEDAMKSVVPEMADTADAATAMGAAFQAAFAPLTLLSGNIPQLAKSIGNLSSSFVLKTELKITIKDDSAPKSPSAPLAPLSPSVAGAVHAAVQTSLRTATRGVVNNSTIASHGAGAWQTVLGSAAFGGGH